MHAIRHAIHRLPLGSQRTVRKLMPSHISSPLLARHHHLASLGFYLLDVVCNKHHLPSSRVKVALCLLLCFGDTHQPLQPTTLSNLITGKHIHLGCALLPYSGSSGRLDGLHIGWCGSVATSLGVLPRKQRINPRLISRLGAGALAKAQPVTLCRSSLYSLLARSGIISDVGSDIVNTSVPQRLHHLCACVLWHNSRSKL